MKVVAVVLMSVPMLFILLILVDAGMMGALLYVLYCLATGASLYAPKIGWKLWQRKSKLKQEW